MKRQAAGHVKENVWMYRESVRKLREDVDMQMRKGTRKNRGTESRWER